MTREWGTRAPNSVQLECEKCGKKFWTTSGVRKYCDDHLTTFVPGGKEAKCRSCGVKFNTSRNHHLYCPKCANSIAEGNKEKSALLLAAHVISIGYRQPTLVDPDIAIQSTDVADEVNDYLLLNDDYAKEISELVHDLERNEVMYGASVTEHHTHGSLEVESLELAISRVKPEKIEKFRKWAKQEMNGVEPLQESWKDLPETEKEQWVVNLLNRFNTTT